MLTRKQRGDRERGGGEVEQVVQSVECYSSNPRLFGRMGFFFTAAAAAAFPMFLRAMNYVSS